MTRPGLILNLGHEMAPVKIKSTVIHHVAFEFGQTLRKILSLGKTGLAPDNSPRPRQPTNPT